MKKAIFGIIAILTVFAMVSCGGGSSSTTPPPDTRADYTVTFVSNGGTAVPVLTVKDGDKLTLGGIAPTTKDLFDFAGWYKNSTLTTAWDYDTDTVTANTTLYAKWDRWASGAEYFTVIFYDGTTVFQTYDVAQATGGTGVALTAPTTAETTKAGYRFDGWFKEAALTNAWTFTTDKVTTDNTALYGKWTQVWTVTFNLSGGSFGGSIPTTYVVENNGSFANPGIPTRTNYTFEGFFTNAALTIPASFPINITANVTIYAKWFSVYYVTFNYVDNSTLKIEYAPGESTWADVLADVPAAKKADAKAGAFKFGYWEETTGSNTKWDTGATLVQTNIILQAHFFSTAFADTSGALEKVWLNNTQFAVYEFDLAGKDWSTITHISASFKATEADVNTQNTRPIRPMGPYFYSDTAVQNGTSDWYFGDFAVDANGAYAAKFDSGGGPWTDFNKFHPYLLNNVGGWNSPDWSGLAGYGGASAGAVTPDTWFNVKIPTSGYSWNGGTNDPARVKGYIDADTSHAVHPAETDYTKVFFGFGIANASNPHLSNEGHSAVVDQHGITTLIKDVTIYFEDGSTVTGTIPVFPKRVKAEDNATAPAKVGTETTSQIFASYVYNVQYNWRGAPSATVVPPNNPAFVPPTEVPQADTPKLIEDAASLALTAYGNPGVTCTANSASVNVTVKQTGCGFWVGLPSDWNAYETITITYTASKTVTTDPAKVVLKQGKNSFTNDYADGVQYSQYKDIANGGGTMVLKVAGFNSVSAMNAPNGPALSFQINVNGDTDVPQAWTFAITSILFTPGTP